MDEQTDGPIDEDDHWNDIKSKCAFKRANTRNRTWLAQIQSMYDVHCMYRVSLKGVNLGHNS